MIFLERRRGFQAENPNHVGKNSPSQFRNPLIVVSPSNVYRSKFNPRKTNKDRKKTLYQINIKLEDGDADEKCKTRRARTHTHVSVLFGNFSPVSFPIMRETFKLSAGDRRRGEGGVV
ncbi:hypothetical protein GWI33_023044 [Rhynchophorus ferrugineus]|uniref:Uncharacterized protein n=1 Tax=Rhynchophorus ferrugineus TaxID=354439 RepID=A0A834M2M7_RHYFE|nr:hypothetical protein GWI33_023044 [Rhynchophorus ferrugineus]